MTDSNDLTENQVVEFVAAWLVANGFQLTQSPRFNRQAGDDIAAAASDGKLLFVECKGSISQAGSQLKDWDNSAMAIFGAIKDTEEKRPEHLHAIAVPSTTSYRKTIGPLDAFLCRQRIALLWVYADGNVVTAGAPNNSFKSASLR